MNKNFSIRANQKSGRDRGDGKMTVGYIVFIVVDQLRPLQFMLADSLQPVFVVAVD